MRAGSSDAYETQEAAEEEAERLRAERPRFQHAVVEAETAMAALLQSEATDMAGQPLEIEVIRTWNQIQEAIRIRYAVFIDEQGVPEEEELDEHDLPRAWGRTSVHVLGRLGAMRMPVVTARLLIDGRPDEPAHVGRVAVTAWQRRQGHGRAVMRYLEDEARRRGFPGIILHAQLHAVPFYEALGYVADGPVFLEAGIEHRAMELRWD
jgi:predicted GNAT family N-acyltransferase